MPDVRKSLIDKGWRQGVLIKKIDDTRFHAFAHIDLGEDALYLVISQTCDLINPSFDDEPYFEVLRLTPLEGAIVKSGVQPPELLSNLVYSRPGHTL